MHDFDAVYCHRSMAHFGDRISKVLGVPLYVECPVGDVSRLFIVGMYDPPMYGTTLRHTQRAERKHIHWAGTDVLLLSHPELLPDATHSCSGSDLKHELCDKGIDATDIWTPTTTRYEVRPLPPEKRVGVYLGSDARKYGASTINAVMEALPDHEFLVYQFAQFDDMQPVMDACRAYLRLSRHDGDCASAREYMESGRRAVITADLPYAKQVRPDDLVQVVTALRKATSHDEPDWEAAAYYNVANSPEAFLEAVCLL